MQYTVKSFKQLVDQRIAEKGDKQVVNYIWALCNKGQCDNGLKDFIFDDTVTFGDTLKQRIYNIYHDVNEWPLCPICGKKVKFDFFNSGYRKTCSDRCTCVLKYGCRSSLANKEVREKARETMRKRYGDIYQKTQEYKDKVLSTNMKRYGARHIMCTAEGIKKAHAAQIEKYGMLYQQTQEFHDLASRQYKEKNKAEKTAKGQRDAAYERLKEFADKEEFDLLFSKDEYHAEHSAGGKWNYYDFKCRNCGFEFSIMLGNIDRDGIVCPHCQKSGKSKIQHRILLDLRKKYPNEIFLEDAKKLDNLQEIDIFCEGRKFGIEYNGNCWHAQKFNRKMKDYHFNKFLTFIRNKVDVISFWSDEFEHHNSVINSIIDLFMNDSLMMEDVAKIELNVQKNQSLKSLFFTLVSSEDKVAVLKGDEDQILGMIKYVEEDSEVEINEMIHLHKLDFKKIMKKFIDFFPGKRVKFNLDNRLLSYYKKWIPDEFAFERNVEPRFYKLRKGRSLKEYDEAEKVDFEKEDIIWTYGRSIYVYRARQ